MFFEVKLRVLTSTKLLRAACVNTVVSRGVFVALVIFSVTKLVRDARDVDQTISVDRTISGIERICSEAKNKIIDLRATAYHWLTDGERQQTSLDARCGPYIGGKLIEKDATHNQPQLLA